MGMLLTASSLGTLALSADEENSSAAQFAMRELFREA